MICNRASAFPNLFQAGAEHQHFDPGVKTKGGTSHRWRLPSVPPEAVFCGVGDGLVHEQMEEPGQSAG